MSQRWRPAYLGVLCAMIIVAMVSVSAGEARAQESWPRVELSAGTWISVGDTRWAHDASSNPGLGNPTSKLIYKDVGTNVIDLTGKFWFTPKVFGRLNGGFAGIGGGRLTDDDFGSGQRLFSKTISNVPGSSLRGILPAWPSSTIRSAPWRTSGADLTPCASPRSSPPTTAPTLSARRCVRCLSRIGRPPR